MKARQIELPTVNRYTVSLAATLIRSYGYVGESGVIPSPAGSWADTPYILTDAPIRTVREALANV